jgi:hypothetical protein
MGAACERCIDPRRFGLVKAAYEVGETLELLSIGRTSLYAAVKRGELTPVKFGKKTLFCASDLTTFLMRLKQAKGAPSVLWAPQRALGAQTHTAPSRCAPA